MGAPMNPPPRLSVVLGYENSAAGELTAPSRQRCREAFWWWRHHEVPVALTGGFGDHFNTSPQPHHALLARYMRDLGLPEEAVVARVNSRSTVEDAALLADAFPSAEGPGRALASLIVITSDFHLLRAGFVFRTVFPHADLTLRGVPADAATGERHAAHERRRLNDLLTHGLGPWLPARPTDPAR